LIWTSSGMKTGKEWGWEEASESNSAQQLSTHEVRNLHEISSARKIFCNRNKLLFRFMLNRAGPMCSELWVHSTLMQHWEACEIQWCLLILFMDRKAIHTFLKVGVPSPRFPHGGDWQVHKIYLCITRIRCMKFVTCLSPRQLPYLFHSCHAWVPDDAHQVSIW
jgi:hypothetical protein